MVRCKRLVTAQERLRERIERPRCRPTKSFMLEMLRNLRGDSLPRQTAIDSSILQREITATACTFTFGTQVFRVRIDILPSPPFAPRGVL